MKIEDKRLLTTTFAKIEVGECFVDESDDVMLKIENVHINDEEEYNSIDVLTGRMYYTPDSEAVEKVRARVVME